MIQYCRYCVNANGYKGEGEDFLCDANGPCGNHGAGAFYEAKKAKRPNKCAYFEFNPHDIFRVDSDGNFEEYKPRGARAAKRTDSGEPVEQISLF